MAKIQTTKNFQAKVPIALWEAWEAWLKDRASLNNTQIMCGFLRLFLHMPREVQLKALSGTEEELIAEVKHQLTDKAFKSGAIYGQDDIFNTEHKQPVRSIERIVKGADPQIIQLLSPEDQAKMEEFRRLVGPDPAEGHRRRKTS